MIFLFIDFHTVCYLGRYVTMIIRDVPIPLHLATRLLHQQQQDPMIINTPLLSIFSLLPHEIKLSVLNFNVIRYQKVSSPIDTVEKDKSNKMATDTNVLTDDDIIQSKDELIFMVSYYDQCYIHILKYT